MATILRDMNDDEELGTLVSNPTYKMFISRPSQYRVETSPRRMLVVSASLIWELADMGVDILVFTVDGKRYTTDITEWTLQAVDMGDSYALPVQDKRLG